MRATLKLLNSYFFTTVYGPMLAFFFPTLLVAILGNIMRIEYIFPGVMAMVTMFIGTLALPLGLMELKQSSLFKYIGASPVNNKKFTIVVILYYVFIIFVAIWLLMGVTAIIFHKDVFPKGNIMSIHEGIFSGIYTWFGSLSFFLANCLHILLALCIGLAIATFSKTPQQALTIGLMIVIPSMFLSGMVLSVDIIGQSEVMQWISRLFIFRYTTGNIIVASTPVDQIGDMIQHLTVSEKTVLFNNVVRAAAPEHFIHGTHDVNPDWTAWNKLSEKFHTLAGQKYWGTNVVAKLGDIYGYSASGKLYIVNDVDSLRNAELHMDPSHFTGWNGNIVAGNVESAFVSDYDLYKLAFSKVSEPSDNNIFNFARSWGVRRVPEVDPLRDFITQYFRGSDGKGGDTQRYIKIYEKYILHNDYGWLNVFFKQTNVLYTVADRILNIFLPLTSSSVLLWYSVKKFEWSSR